MFDITKQLTENNPAVTVRVVFMGTPPFAATVLEALLRSSCQVVAVYTQPDRPAGRGHRVVHSAVKRLSIERQLPVIQPRSLRSEEVVGQMARLQPDLIIVAAFGLLLPAGVLTLPRSGCLNVHPSLLPRHRGPSPIANAVLCGDDVTGVTIMLMDAGLDTGPILTQERVSISPSDTTGSLGVRLADAGGKLMLDTLPRWLGGELKPQTQDASRATYSSLITHEDAEVDWRRSAPELWRRARAYNPWPGFHTWCQGKRLKIHEAVPLGPVAHGGIGEVVLLDEPPGIGVVTGQGVLGLRRVQVEGKREVSAEEFARGKRDFAGLVLGSR
jgi:methionyl-tRNA formyltransferase